MATATLKHGAHKLLGHSKSATSDPSPVDQEKCRQEKQFITDWIANAKPLPPEQIKDSAGNKALATSSRQLRIQDFELIKTLGTGTFARVWLAALAVIRLKQVEHIRNERSTLAAVAGHPFITTLITTFSDRDCLYMLLDYCPGGEVFHYLRQATKFDINTARFYAAEIVLILEFLHTIQGIAYRDMKPENILVDAQGHLKLVDFGFAKKIETKKDWPGWNAIPTPTVTNVTNLENRICGGKIKYPSDMDPDARSLIGGLCTVNPTHRLGNLSGGVDRVKSHPFFASIGWEKLYYRQMKGPIIPKLRHQADTSNFDEYDPVPEKQSVYTKEMHSKYDHEFKEF
ncbi:MAG: hypothetical protein Q9220_000304 [cf. Caloplaca sp. 1 TL-2023]